MRGASVFFAPMNQCLRFFPAVLAVAAIAACQPNSPPASAPASQAAPAAEDFATVEHEYAVYMMSRFPVVATYLGGSTFDPALAQIDGKLRDYSPEGLRAEDARLSGFRDRFHELEKGLSPRRRIDRSVALAEIEFLLHQHQVLRHQQRALDSFVDEPFRGVDWQIQGMTPTGSATYGTQAEWQEVINRTRSIPAYLATAESQISAGVAAQATPDWRVLIEHGLNSTRADAEYFSTTLPKIAAADIASPQREQLLNDLGAACKDAAAAYLKLRAFVASTFFNDPEGKDVSALKPQYREDHFALGEMEYDWALHNNLRLEATAGELFAQSSPVVSQTRDSMVSLAREIAAGHKWKAPSDGPGVVRMVFAKLSLDAPRTDAQMVEGYRRTGEELVAYARKVKLFDVPADYRLDVTVTPPPLQSSIEGAAYYPAPPFKKAGVGRFYVTPTGNDIAELRQEHNYAAMADLAAHEGFPGHDWHYKVMTQYRDGISPIRWLTPGAVEDSSSMWQDSMAAEGWALYSESLLAEPQPGASNGFYSPEQRLYQLRGLLYRELRVRIDTGIHTGRMQFEEAVTLFSETVDFLPGSCQDTKELKVAAKRASCDGARRAITRYSRWPTQAITYEVGKNQILALRKRAQQELGERYSAQRFHLEFMKQGTIPPGYFAAELLLALKSPPAGQ
jgi:uncharacterized protein (DUF885 family)